MSIIAAVREGRDPLARKSRITVQLRLAVKREVAVVIQNARELQREKEGGREGEKQDRAILLS